MAAFKTRLYTAQTRKAARIRRRRSRKKGHNEINSFIHGANANKLNLVRTKNRVDCLQSKILDDFCDGFCESDNQINFD